MHLTQENNLNVDATLLNIENLSISTQDQPLLRASFKFASWRYACNCRESGSGKTISCLAMMGLLPEKLKHLVVLLLIQKYFRNR